MHLLVVRHGIAEGRKASARTNRDDAARRLTAEGRRKMKNGALGLRQLVPEVDLLASSPLRRAADTAEIIARAYGELRVKQVPELAPGGGPGDSGFANRFLSSMPATKPPTGGHKASPPSTWLSADAVPPRSWSRNQWPRITYAGNVTVVTKNPRNMSVCTRTRGYSKTY